MAGASLSHEIKTLSTVNICKMLQNYFEFLTVHSSPSIASKRKVVIEQLFASVLTRESLQQGLQS
jgi:hypothetical protein